MADGRDAPSPVHGIRRSFRGWGAELTVVRKTTRSRNAKEAVADPIRELPPPRFPGPARPLPVGYPLPGDGDHGDVGRARAAGAQPGLPRALGGAGPLRARRLVLPARGAVAGARRDRVDRHGRPAHRRVRRGRGGRRPVRRRRRGPLRPAGAAGRRGRGADAAVRGGPAGVVAGPDPTGLAAVRAAAAGRGDRDGVPGRRRHGGARPGRRPGADPGERPAARRHRPRGGRGARAGRRRVRLVGPGRRARRRRRQLRRLRGAADAGTPSRPSRRDRRRGGPRGAVGGVPRRGAVPVASPGAAPADRAADRLPPAHLRHGRRGRLPPQARPAPARRHGRPGARRRRRGHGHRIAGRRAAAPAVRVRGVLDRRGRGHRRRGRGPRVDPPARRGRRARGRLLRLPQRRRHLLAVAAPGGDAGAPARPGHRRVLDDPLLPRRRSPGWPSATARR
ncbi:hypothetical protein GA0070558_116107 [Micromonospora haikouensis]|uniref:Uncharacterized protein n=1 Tax=Micromonospora haikouensis TaxID=686309 RepID=A0A1C4WLK5_9ACTN|nr:hypothetical protein GA0070558_116107 [Micromonospora haikouensis]